MRWSTPIQELTFQVAKRDVLPGEKEYDYGFNFENNHFGEIGEKGLEIRLKLKF